MTEIISKKERKDIICSATSKAIREDFRTLSKNKYDPFKTNGKFDIDRMIRFLTEFNEFIGHRQKPFKRITGNTFRL